MTTSIASSTLFSNNISKKPVTYDYQFTPSNKTKIDLPSQRVANHDLLKPNKKTSPSSDVTVSGPFNLETYLTVSQMTIPSFVPICIACMYFPFSTLIFLSIGLRLIIPTFL